MHSRATYIDREQSRWLEKETADSRAEWKIAFLHHPLYTSGRYTLAARGIRFALESSLVSGGVNVVFSGHEHIYERAEMQKGMPYQMPVPPALVHAYVAGGCKKYACSSASSSTFATLSRGAP